MKYLLLLCLIPSLALGQPCTNINDEMVAELSKWANEEMTRDELCILRIQQNLLMWRRLKDKIEDDNKLESTDAMKMTPAQRGRVINKMKDFMTKAKARMGEL